MKRCVVLLALLLLLAVVVAGCGGDDSEPQQPTNGETAEEDGVVVEQDMVVEEPDGEAMVFTLAELAEFDGKDGNPAYIAVDGIVYDVAGHSTWQNGDHTPCNLDAMAGRDLTEALEQSPPRMRDYVLALPVVGMLVE
jgi:predicted heme/steroid binding protein